MKTDSSFQSSSDGEDHHLPVGTEFFSVPFLAKLCSCHPKHIHELIDNGEIKVSFNLAGKGSTKSMRRIPRAAVVEFLNRRKNK